MYFLAHLTPNYNATGSSIPNSFAPFRSVIYKHPLSGIFPKFPYGICGKQIDTWIGLCYLFSRLYNVSTPSCAHLTIILSSSSSCLCHSSLLVCFQLLYFDTASRGKLEIDSPVKSRTVPKHLQYIYTYIQPAH